MIREQLEKIKNQALSELLSAENEAALEELRVKVLGKKSELSAVLRGMGKLSAEERPVVGALANEVRAAVENALAERREIIMKKIGDAKLAAERIDVTMPGKAQRRGNRHPLGIVEYEMAEIFRTMGFDIVEGPEVEYDYYNFQALNIPENHPARDTQDTT